MKRILLSILVIGIFLLGACGTPTTAPALPPAPEPQPAPASAPTPEPELIPAPLPVEEPEPKPAPPIVVEESALTSEEQAYMIAVQDHFSKINDLFAEIDVLFEDPKIDNEEWIVKVLVQTYMIKWVCFEDAMNLVPPTSMNDIHLKYLEAMKHMGMAALLIAPYIDDIDPDQFEAAFKEKRIGTELMTDTIRLMNLYKIEHKE